MTLGGKISVLQYWHEDLNKMFFGGELGPALIVPLNDEDNESGENEAVFSPLSEPFLIQFNRRTLVNGDIFEDQFSEKILTILLHEMVHQYCEENWIESIDDRGNHTSEFADQAAAHGLTSGGYRLSEDARACIVERREVCADVFRILESEEGE